jgi:hypothetical protein
LPWILAGIGLIVICCIGIVLLYVGLNYNIDMSPAPIPTITQRAPLTPTPPAPPTLLHAPPTVAVPHGVQFVLIKAITVNAQNQYVVDYVTYE